MSKEATKMNDVEKSDGKQSNKIRLPKFEINDEGVCRVILEDEGQLAAIFGGSCDAFDDALLSQCLNVSGSSEKLSNDKVFAVAVVAEIAPQDAVESLLATQMAAIHIATMRHSRLMAGAETIQQLEVQERVLNKLARTFTTQMEALRKHRNGGKQTVTVQHVNVEDGGQAIVGNVAHRGEGSNGK